MLTECSARLYLTTYQYFDIFRPKIRFSISKFRQNVYFLLYYVLWPRHNGKKKSVIILDNIFLANFYVEFSFFNILLVNTERLLRMGTTGRNTFDQLSFGGKIRLEMLRL